MRRRDKAAPVVLQTFCPVCDGVFLAEQDLFAHLASQHGIDLSAAPTPPDSSSGKEAKAGKRGLLSKVAKPEKLGSVMRRSRTRSASQGASSSAVQRSPDSYEALRHQGSRPGSPRSGWINGRE